MVVRRNPPFTLPVVTKFLVVVIIVCWVEQSLRYRDCTCHCVERRCSEADVIQETPDHFQWDWKLLNDATRFIDISQVRHTIVCDGLCFDTLSICRAV